MSNELLSRRHHGSFAPVLRVATQQQGLHDGYLQGWGRADLTTPGCAIDKNGSSEVAPEKITLNNENARFRNLLIFLVAMGGLEPPTSAL